MRIIRFIDGEISKYGIIEGKIVKEISGSIFSSFEILDRRHRFDQLKIIQPVDPPNIYAIGLNYKKHAQESGLEQLPERPIIFLKATTSVTGPDQYILLPDKAPNEVDFEAELAIIIGKKARNLAIEEVDKYILGYTCANDVSARDCQLRLDSQWARGKSFDTFCPIGPWIETDLEPNNQVIQSRLNGQIMQESNTADMIFNTRYLVSYLSQNFTLLPGTVILTGTPEGVGFARKPPVYLREDDIIEIEIEGIGVLRNKVARGE